MSRSEKLRLILGLRSTGLTYKAIADRLDICELSVRNFLAAPKQLQLSIRQKANHRCHECGKRTTSGHVWRLEETVERWNDEANLRYSCVPCYFALKPPNTCRSLQLNPVVT